MTNPEFVRWVLHPNCQLDDYWKKWMNANPDQIDNLKLAREFLLGLQINEIKPKSGEKEKLLRELLQNKVTHPKKDSMEVPSKSKAPSIWKGIGQFQRVAAILAMGFLISWLLLENNQMPDDESIESKPITLVKEARAGEKVHFKLHDGTLIWLNSRSKVEFPQQFGEKERRVRIEGEAFFEVAGDAERPFVVETNGVSATVLGTSFNVSAKPNKVIRVALVTGELKVTSTHKMEDFFLKPGIQLSFDIKAQEGKLVEFDVNQITAWKNGVLIFKDAGLEEIINTLEDWYGVKIYTLNSKKEGWNYSGEFHGQTLESVLNSISYTKKFSYSIDDKDVTFKF